MRNEILSKRQLGERNDDLSSRLRVPRRVFISRFAFMYENVET